MDDHQRSVTLRVCVSSGVSSALLSEVLEKECVFCVNESLKFEEVKKKKTVDDQTVVEKIIRRRVFWGDKKHGN